MTSSIIPPYTGQYYKDYAHLLSTFDRVKVGEEKYNKIYKHVQELIEFKKTEVAHQRDYKSRFKRHMTGKLAEAAMENYLKTSIIDYTISDSKEHNVADLSTIGLNIGIKSIEYGKFPLVEIRSKRPEIILIKEQTKPWFWICGIYDVDTLRKYSTTDLIWDTNIQNKTCFYAIDKGTQFKTLDDLKKYCRVT